MNEISVELWSDGFWQSADDLRLHYRDYGGGSGDAARPPLLCLPGLTRNARDFAALAGRPLLLVRGELSDVLSQTTLAEMQHRLPDAEAVTLARIGHAPTLDEPEAAAAIDRLLARVA